jgi:putative PEP-CTERM system TPR-repeat lipoprotein
MPDTGIVAEEERPMHHRGRGGNAGGGALFVGGVCVAGLLLTLAAAPPATARTAQDYVAAAQQYLKKGDPRAAEIELRNALLDAPKDPTIHLRLSAVYLLLGNNADAAREAKTAGTLGAEEASYLPPLMDALLRERKFGELLGGVSAGNRAPSLESKVREGRALAYAGLRDYNEALANLHEAVRLDPESPQPQIALARVLLSTREAAKAETVIDQVLAKNPRSADALSVKGQILAVRGAWDDAMHKFNEALEIDPKNLQAHLGRANLYLLHQDATNADKDLNPVLASAPNNAAANYLRALELAQHRQFSAANQLLDKISPAFPDLVEGYYLQGVVQDALGQVEQAENNLTKYVARVPDSAKAVRLLAVIAMRRGGAARAIDDLKQLLEKSPADVATLSLLGKAYLADGKPEIAMAQFEAAAKLAPQNPQVNTQLAVSQINTGQGEQGLALLENVFESEAGATVAGPVLVLTELRVGHVDKAAEVAQALVAKDNNNPVYQTLLGLVRFVGHDYKGAETALRAVVAREPGFAPATHNLAQVYIATGRRDEARKAYEALVAQKPNNVTALLALADLAMADRDWKAAADYVNRARSAAPADPKPGIALVDLYLQQQNYRDAKSIGAELLTLFPKDPGVLDAQARIQRATGDAAGAAATYRRAFEMAPKSAMIRGRYLAALLAAKDFKTARDVLTEALAREPSNVAIKGDLIRVEADIDGIDAGIAKAHEFAAQDPNNPAYDLVVAELYEKAGRAADAIALLEKRQEAKPAEAVMMRLVQLYMSGGQPAKAEALLQARLEKEPGDLSARIAYASQYLQRQELDRAREEFERVVAQSPTSVVALNNLAWLYQQQGDIAKARSMAERAVALAPRNAAIADTLGWIMMAQGDTGTALKYLKTAGASSHNPDIQYHLAVALKKTGQPADAKTLLESILSSGATFPSKADAEKLLQELKKG